MEALLARRERQGLSWADLSRRSGLPVWKLRWWSKRLSPKLPVRKPRRSFVAVQIIDSPRPDPPALEIVTPSGFRLRVPADFDPDHLRRLVATLEAGC